MSLQKFRQLSPARKIIWLLVIWQAISVALMAVGTWPVEVAIVNAVLLALFVIIAQPYLSVLLLILSTPFYVILPNPYLANLPMWRPLFVLLFVVWFVRAVFNQRAYIKKMLSFRRWYEESLVSGSSFWGVIGNTIKRIDSRFMPWDKTAALFVILALFSLLIARFQIHGFKQILFLVNIYFLYLVVINTVTDEEKVREIIKYVTYSLGMIVGLGFVQYASTLFALPYYFWQYWAIQVSSLYYGQSLADVLAYSNSWFSGNGGGQSLRMFGIMPDTHSFAVLCIFLLGYLYSFTEVPKRWQINLWQYVKEQRKLILVALILAAFAIMAAGTRGVWVGMLAPVAIFAVAYLLKFTKPLLKISFVIYGLVVLMFLLSPLIGYGLNAIRNQNTKDNFLGRASSIYDLSESSNEGRLEIWKNSISFAALHPFGVGYGNFITSFKTDIPEDSTFEETSASKNMRYNLPEKFVTAHSLYLHILVELGFAGLLALALFGWEYAEGLWKFLKQFGREHNHYTLFVVGSALAVIWLFAYGAFDLTLFNDKVLQYLLVTLGINGLVFAKYKAFNRHV